ncbi:isochorismatase family protein, partial [Thalassospira xiamenensis]|uniref:isochorismatase family protein n=1 Tax=Thalassospira xiamenensis TaxID=220697 RepID=UPI000DEDC4EF
AVKPDIARPLPCWQLIGQSLTYDFFATDLEKYLLDHGITRLVFTGVVIHNSMDASIRVAHCLGFDVILPLDATTAIDVTDAKGVRHDAQTVFDLFAAVLGSEYCTLSTTDDVDRRPARITIMRPENRALYPLCATTIHLVSRNDTILPLRIALPIPAP